MWAETQIHPKVCARPTCRKRWESIIFLCLQMFFLNSQNALPSGKRNTMDSGCNELFMNCWVEPAHSTWKKWNKNWCNSSRSPACKKYAELNTEAQARRTYVLLWFISRQMTVVLCPLLSGVLWIHILPTFFSFLNILLILQIYDLMAQGPALSFQLMFKVGRRRKSGWSSLLFFKKCQESKPFP